MPSIDVPEINPTTKRDPRGDFSGTVQLLFAGSKTPVISEKSGRSVGEASARTVEDAEDFDCVRL